jgi:hypothetical protein
VSFIFPRDPHLSTPTHATLDCWTNSAAALGSICGIPWRITFSGRGEYRLFVGSEYHGSFTDYPSAMQARNQRCIALSMEPARAAIAADLVEQELVG